MSNVPLPPSEPEMKAHNVGTYDIPDVEVPLDVEPVRTPAAAVPPPSALPPEPTPVEPTRRSLSWVWWLVLVIVLVAVLWWAWSALRPSNAGRLPAPAAHGEFALIQPVESPHLSPYHFWPGHPVCPAIEVPGQTA